MKAVDGKSPLKVFGEMLKFFRERAGLSAQELATAVIVSLGLLRKIEAGTRAPSADLVKRCEGLARLRCEGVLQQLYDSMAEYLRVGIFPGWFAGWPGMEAVARRLRNFESMVIPGLLQTEGYSSAIISARLGITVDELHEEVDARLNRQAILTRDKPVELWVILDEVVLRRPVGSKEVMREALMHLLEMARRPNIVVQVIPLEAGAHVGLDGPFMIAEFDNAADAAYQDTAVSGQIIEDQDGVRQLARTWDGLQRVTLTEPQSLRKIEETITELWT
ncbi:MAG TPA: helix-turn-helix transcriptional regulator [Trebonia sp.]|nr:helix-turn-helix transcriptional regulator [Trebonia sp.]